MAEITARLVTGALIAAAFVYAIHFDMWPRSVCHTVAPFGQHDYQCTFYIGR